MSSKVMHGATVAEGFLRGAGFGRRPLRGPVATSRAQVQRRILPVYPRPMNSVSNYRAQMEKYLCRPLYRQDYTDGLNDCRTESSDAWT